MHHHEENGPVDSETFNVGMSGVGLWPVGIRGGHSSLDLMQEYGRATGVNNLKIMQDSAEILLIFHFCLKHDYVY
jgi:hypothetical protein